MGLVNPAVAIVLALCFLIVLLYRRVNLGIVLPATALLLALLSLDWSEIPLVLYRTTDPLTSEGQLTISVVLATFTIMLLSQLYKETRMINRLSESISGMINNPKIVLGIIPAVIGFLPVAGGALMSAPIVDMEAEKLKLKPEKKAYINFWFRHTIFPVYPITQPLIVAAGLTGVAIPLIVLRQIPVVLVMIVVGFVISFWKVSNIKKAPDLNDAKRGSSHLREFLVAFSPILVTIVLAVVLDIVSIGLEKQGFDVLVATLGGLVVLIYISKSSLKVFLKASKNLAIYGIVLAAYGAFLLRNVMVAVGISNIFSPLVANGSIDLLLLLTFVPAVLGLITGSPQGGVALGVSILSGIVASFTPNVASLIYISAYLGYTVAPTHLCFTFTADYFKCPLGRVYKYVIPSFLAAFLTALTVYFLF